jgi:hypothetical protein
VEEKRKQKMNDAYYTLYITALVAGVLELETNVLHARSNGEMHMHRYHGGYTTGEQSFGNTIM